ncbi:TetR/AcrR family transcriptional regulator [Nonomuraea sp. MG754425]|uniref:TetR/AcrR family transcriptional regulator n=1 Tax=Nonomuraea sp. MG754425 TaxID=2570319 RepID=UPI001F2E8E8B|nr:TetR/AcrR family transcriptional regulator [Nonomuraea sp. MG754425]
MSTDTLGLREQKKRETRQAISDHATQLFLERGFDRTTIADIAAAARVAKMTVTNYFPRKEDLALDHHADFAAGPALAVAQREPGESALAAVRRAYLAALDRRDPVIGFTGRDFARMVADSPTLAARLRDLHDQREEALAAQLIRETPEDPVAARAVAAQLAAADRLLFRELRARVLAGEDALGGPRTAGPPDTARSETGRTGAGHLGTRHALSTTRHPDTGHPDTGHAVGTTRHPDTGHAVGTTRHPDRGHAHRDEAHRHAAGPSGREESRRASRHDDPHHADGQGHHAAPHHLDRLQDPHPVDGSGAIAGALAAIARRVFGLLEPSIGGYAVR